MLVDTSVWIDHLRTGDPSLVQALEAGRVLGHPWVIGELALGHLTNRDEVVRLLADLPPATVATHAEVMTLIDRQHLAGVEIGYVDAHLLASTLLSADVRIWTRDRRLLAVAEGLGLAAE